MSTPTGPDQPGEQQYQQPQYQQGTPAYPSAPPVSEEQAGPVAQPPMPLTVSFWCWILSALLGIVGALLLFGQKQTIIDALRKAETSTQLTDAQLQTAANAALVVALVVSIIIAALYVFFAFKLRQGRNWARIVLLIVTVLSLISLFTQSNTTSVLRDIAVVVAVIAVVLSFLPQSNAYIAAVKANRNR